MDTNGSRSRNAVTSRGRKIPPAGIVKPLRVEAEPPTLETDERAEAFAVGLLALAEEVERADAELWEAVEQMAGAGDSAGILALARKRRSAPPCEAVKLLTASPSRAA